VCTGCWWGSLRERGHWGDQDVDGRIILRWIFRKLEGIVRTGWSWLRIGTDGGPLWVRCRTFEFRARLSSFVNAGNFLTSCKIYC
jgi:hypothetical protein